MLEQYLPVKPWLATRRKIRGKKRFFARIIRMANQFALPEKDDLHGWWHWHADFWGNGNRGWKYRSKYIEAHCIVFKKFAENLHLYQAPYQLYVRLSLDDACSDAIYFDTPDPVWHKPPYEFPFKSRDAEWGIPELEKYFSKMLAPYKIRCGYDQHQILIYSPDFGEPLEQANRCTEIRHA